MSQRIDDNHKYSQIHSLKRSIYVKSGKITYFKLHPYKNENFRLRIRYFKRKIGKVTRCERSGVI